jgi:2-oxoisovalerate dehydrogenase E1 component beta subunit
MKTVLEAIREGLADEMRRDDRVIVLGEDVGAAGGVFGATVGLQAEFGEARVLDTPLAESSIVGVAIGAAFNNIRPVAEIQFMDFIHPAMNQIMNEAARIRYRSAGDFACPIVVRVPFGGGVHGGLYHSQSIEALFCHIPGLKCVAPSSPYDAKGLLKAAIRDDDPVIFCEHKRTYRLIKGDVPDTDYIVPIGKAIVRRPGTQITLLTYGLMVYQALEAAESLAEQDVDVEIVDLRTLRPLDEDAILDSVRKTGKVLILHEANKTGGLGGEIAALIAEYAFDALDGPITRLCGADVPAMGYAPELEHAFMPDPGKIEAALKELAAY